MEHYFIMQENQQQGPFDLEELAIKRLKQDTLVWYEGLKRWQKACEIDELKILFISKGIPLFITDLNFSPLAFGYKVKKTVSGKKHSLILIIFLLLLLFLACLLIFK